ncbi:MAG: bifunctional riboflavin kinase/FAD synthetase [Paracoccaceae bacterium]
MRIIRDYQSVTDPDRGATAAIGNFDGVHLGHQAVIAQAQAMAPDAPLGVVTFSPHPRAFFNPGAPAFRLMHSATRAARLGTLGVERLYDLTFTADLAALSPEAFAKDVLHDGLGLTHIVVGADFRFGKGRAGDATDLRRFGDQFGFGVTVAQMVDGPAGQVSSTRIREALSTGHPQDAAAMLGHWHRMDGPIIGGERRGRELGFPTANMAIDGLHLPKFGVYAVLVDVQDGPHAGRYHGAASLGVRPMFDGDVPNLETFVFDFSGDLYGATLSVALVAFLRPEATFDGLEALIAQMDADCDQARRLLEAL